MTRESVAFAVSGTCFGLLVGWLIAGSQQARTVASVPVTPPAAETSVSQQAPPLDTVRAAELERRAAAEPRNAAVRAELGNLYVEARQFDQARTWFEASLKIDPKNPDVSTGLAVSYYSTDQVDLALKQFDHSLALDPRSLKALLYQGVVRAFGKQDLAGASESWQRVVALAPNSEEARQAQQGLDGIRAAHPGPTAAPPGAGGGSR